MLREKDTDRVENLYAKVDAYRLVENLEQCLQCGKCVGVCPVANLSPSYNPRQIINDILSGREERWLKSEEIWRCFWCANCFTLCPMDICFPLLMMEMRYRAIESGYGLKYFFPFKRFALRAREDGLTFAPASKKGREKIVKIRQSIGTTPWPEVSQKARDEYKALFDRTGATAFLEAIKEEDEKPVQLTYLEGKIINARRKDD
ncbi:MAG: 4Fe-4S dicluster domain-containing protein [Desulfobaccales bacterium]|jgi:heterodisulfide reductase subunit C